MVLGFFGTFWWVLLVLGDYLWFFVVFFCCCWWSLVVFGDGDIDDIFGMGFWQFWLCLVKNMYRVSMPYGYSLLMIFGHIGIIKYGGRVNMTQGYSIIPNITCRNSGIILYGSTWKTDTFSRWHRVINVWLNMDTWSTWQMDSKKNHDYILFIGIHSDSDQVCWSGSWQHLCTSAPSQN